MAEAASIAKAVRAEEAIWLKVISVPCHLEFRCDWFSATLFPGDVAFVSCVSRAGDSVSCDSALTTIQTGRFRHRAGKNWLKRKRPGASAGPRFWRSVQ